MNPSFLWADGNTFGARSAPWLPALDSLPWLRHAAWSLVLAAVVVLLGAMRRGDGAAVRTGWLALLVAAWAWVPGAWGVAYWLGLAFQIPSVLSCVLALGVLMRAYTQRADPEHEARWVSGPAAADDSNAGPGAWAAVLLGAGVLLGWVLLLDAFALFPMAVYAWGFAPSAFLVVCALALVPWVVTGAAVWRTSPVWQVGVAMALFAVSRWPSGNVWDALLDPWLWLVLNALAVRAVVRWWAGRA